MTSAWSRSCARACWCCRTVARWSRAPLPTCWPPRSTPIRGNWSACARASPERRLRPPARDGKFRSHKGITYLERIRLRGWEEVPMSSAKRLVLCAAAFGAAAVAPHAHAISFELDVADGINGTLNTTMTIGAGVRMQDRASDLVGKGNLNPGLCGGDAQSCQGVFRDELLPSQTLANSPGQAFLNADDGNLNYDKHDLTQAVFKVTQDVNMSYGEFGLFAKWLYFYDFVNNDFTEFHPNWITA